MNRPLPTPYRKATARCDVSATDNITTLEKLGNTKAALSGTESELAHQAAMCRLIVENMAELIIRFDAASQRVYVSPSSYEMLGYDPAVLLSKEAPDIIHPDDLKAAEAVFKRVGPDHPHLNFNFRVRRQDNVYIWVEGHYRHLSDDNGLLMIMRDVTARKRAEDNLAEINRKLAAANIAMAAREKQLEQAKLHLDKGLDGMSQGLCLFGGDHRLVLANRRYSDMYGLRAGDLCPGMTLADIYDLHVKSGVVPLIDRASYLASRADVVRRREVNETVIEMKAGKFVCISYRPMPDGGWIATHEDVTQRQIAGARIAFLAHHDTLTGLANRRLLYECLEEARTSGTVATMLSLDLDHFKHVNDTMGHLIGDQLLREVAARLEACVMPGTIVARMGGDEFAIICRGMTMPDDAAILAETIAASIREPYYIEKHRVVIGTSLGIAIADPTLTTEELMQHADLALYHAKDCSRGTYQFFEAAMYERHRAREAMESSLQHAIANHELELLYQPIIDIQKGKVIGFEALLRWNHPTKGVLAPNEFIAIAENSGLILPIGAWVLQQACVDAATWPDTINVAVNLSPIQFKDPALVETVRHALTLSRLPSRRLDLEITESTLLQKTEITSMTLGWLRDMGHKINMDDFGTGYSSLSYLHSFPFDKIKIDRSFIMDIGERRESIEIVRAVTGLARGLDIKTVAEGVETRDQLKHAQAAGCTEAQGYFFSKPCTAQNVNMTIARANRIMHDYLGYRHNHHDDFDLVATPDLVR